MRCAEPSHTSCPRSPSPLVISGGPLRVFTRTRRLLVPGQQGSQASMHVGSQLWGVLQNTRTRAPEVRVQVLTTEPNGRPPTTGPFPQALLPAHWNRRGIEKAVVPAERSKQETLVLRRRMAATQMSNAEDARVARCVLSLLRAPSAVSGLCITPPGPTLPPALAQPHPDSLRPIT